MRIVIYSDNTLAIPVTQFVAALNKVVRNVQFFAGKSSFRVKDPSVSSPRTYNAMPKSLRDEIDGHDLALLATATPYDNNYFFESVGNAVIISFADWAQLTDLPVTNGLAYFVASILVDILRLGSTHDEGVGCINDFLWDKRDVNACMRAASFCKECRSSIHGKAEKHLADVELILDVVSRASRACEEIVSVLDATGIQSGDSYDVFLSHNSQDKPAIRGINQYFKDRGIVTWLDEEQLPLGQPWQPRLEEQIEAIRCAVVCVADSGLGPWQDIETRALLAEFVRRAVPVIPVILPSVQTVPKLPLFLSAMTWVDLRKDEAIGLERLAQAIKSHRVPGRAKVSDKAKKL